MVMKVTTKVFNQKDQEMIHQFMIKKPKEETDTKPKPDNSNDSDDVYHSESPLYDSSVNSDSIISIVLWVMTNGILSTEKMHSTNLTEDWRAETTISDRRILLRNRTVSAITSVKRKIMGRRRDPIILLIAVEMEELKIRKLQFIEFIHAVGNSSRSFLYNFIIGIRFSCWLHMLNTSNKNVENSFTNYAIRLKCTSRNWR
ncbi:hypothetical protein Glove_209g15 [Diversispora epigaea]|uniref:Uncharacterized protein n=1 Tax=Diversispora epigaea TaxID=1348612 RepID=A0A397INN5_9GLOM|nr:hypothetical protein Glove_209g15 [Diversispora epigaea]